MNSLDTSVNILRYVFLLSTGQCNGQMNAMWGFERNYMHIVKHYTKYLNVKKLLLQFNAGLLFLKKDEGSA